MRLRLSAPQIILLGFTALILIGTLLLSLPISSASGDFTSPRKTLFTAVSATCVTGLVVVDTGTYWSAFGQVVIITMIQIGGLGFMTLAVMLSLIAKRRITPREQLLTAQALGLTGISGTVGLVKRILIGTFTVEGIGAVIFASQFVPLFGWGRGILCGIFHSISFFCNAGFDILGFWGGPFSSLTAFAGNPVITLTATALIIIGGIGFVIWDDLVNFILRRQRISVYSRLILITTAILLFGGALAIGLFEWNNPDTIGSKPLGEKLLQCFFQSVTTRTAGVDMINNAAMTDGSKLISMLLMFIGGSSGSTAGGLKVGTFAVLVLSVVAFSRGQNEVSILKRRIGADAIHRALSIAGINLALVLFASLVITATTPGCSIVDALYEACSAIATVGLSLSLTPHISLIGHILLMAMMFFGRVGILTFTYSLMLRQARRANCITYPDIQMMIG